MGQVIVTRALSQHQFLSLGLWSLGSVEWSHPFYSSQTSCSFATQKSLCLLQFRWVLLARGLKVLVGLPRFQPQWSCAQRNPGVLRWYQTRKWTERQKVSLFPSLSLCPCPQWLLAVLSLDLASGLPLIVGIELFLQSSNSIHMFYQSRQRAKLDPVLAGRQRTRKGSYFWKNVWVHDISYRVG